MTDAEKAEILATMRTQDECGVHFWAKYDPSELLDLQEEGLIVIHEPLFEDPPDPVTSYTWNYWWVEVTEAGQRFVAEHTNKEACR
ncbi:MAG: hypothetical protein ABFE07_24240 [Armatimonadia bacterium]